MVESNLLEGLRSHDQLWTWPVRDQYHLAWPVTQKQWLHYRTIRNCKIVDHALCPEASKSARKTERNSEERQSPKFPWRTGPKAICSRICYLGLVYDLLTNRWFEPSRRNKYKVWAICSRWTTICSRWMTPNSKEFHCRLLDYMSGPDFKQPGKVT